MIACEVDTPLGRMMMADEGSGLAGLWFPGQRHFPNDAAGWPRGRSATLEEAAQQLDAYFAGRRQAFDLPLASAGSAFQQSVWQYLQAIPFGQTRSYGEIAQALGKPAASRAVGMAVGRNPWSLVVPCHRVVGSGGQLTGYAGGLERKRWLLALETGQEPPSVGVRPARASRNS